MKARRAALGSLLIASALLPALLNGSATAADLGTLQDRARSAAAGVTEMETKMATLEAEAGEIDARIEAATMELAEIQQQLEAAEASFDAAEDRYIEHAIQAYKMNDPTQLALILSSATIDDMYQVAQATGFAAREISGSIEALTRARSEAERAERAILERRQRLVTAKTRAQEVAFELRVVLNERKERLRSLRKQIRRLEAEARRAAAATANPSGTLLALLGGSGPSSGIPPGFAGTGVVLEGTASWYGPGFEGNLTASGDVFDSSLYTVASKELPLRSWLYVEHEGRGVVVYVNDRGPYVGDRILDLSRAAAEAIGISGLGWVRAEVILKL